MSTQSTFVEEIGPATNVTISPQRTAGWPCSECDYRATTSSSLKQHQDLHEESKTWIHACRYQDKHIELFSKDEGGTPCARFFPTQLKLEYHVKYWHTGQVVLFESERQLAQFLDEQQWEFTHDHQNRLALRECPALDGSVSRRSIRPDFVLLHFFTLERPLCVLVENDEFQHESTRYICDGRRNYELGVMLSLQYPGLPIVLIRLNPHAYTIGEQRFSPPIMETHRMLQQCLEELPAMELHEGLNLVYIHYSQVAEAGTKKRKHREPWEQLLLFQTEDPTMVHLRPSVRLVL